MSKKIVLCFDGTSNQPSDAVQGRTRSGGIEDDGITNVLKLHLLLGGDLSFGGGSGEQRSFYHAGVGTRGSKFRQIYNTTLAPARLDVGRIIRAAVADLKKSYTAGDEVYLFGFSRGAAIARRFASVLPEFFETAPKIRFLGVFDTVASIGVPNLNEEDKPVSDVVFEHGGTIADHIDEALHIISLDERRKAFMPTLMNKDPRVTETWFPGVHSDIGGGYRHDGLSDLTLQYMIDEIEARDLGLRVLEPNQVDLDSIMSPEMDYQIDLDDLLIEPNPFGKAHFQTRPWFTSMLTLGARDPRVNKNDQETDDPPTVHWAAAERIYRDTDYRPKALTRRPHKILHPDGKLQSFAGLAAHLERGIRDLTPLPPGEFKEFVCRAHLRHNHTGLVLEEGAKYLFAIPANQTWSDAKITCDAAGWTREDVKLGIKEWAIAAAEWRRQKPDANWFALVGAVGPSEDEMFELLDHGSAPYVPRRSGELCTFANDVPNRYGNNGGSLRFVVKRLA